VVWKTKEEQLVDQIGMDATIFLRFLRMIRNLFLILTVVGVSIIVPVNVTKNASANAGQEDQGKEGWIKIITPRNVWGPSMWSQVALAWSYDLIIMGFLWWNYRKVLYLRRRYFESEEYQNSLHSRALMVRMPTSEMLN
jgi:hypothetical protein